RLFRSPLVVLVVKGMGRGQRPLPIPFTTSTTKGDRNSRTRDPTRPTLGYQWPKNATSILYPIQVPTTRASYHLLIVGFTTRGQRDP
ncbi:MAG: hypothetical protein DRG31_05850, partial [Deltaproteobacteria bacterium]